MRHAIPAILVVCTGIAAAQPGTAAPPDPTTPPLPMRPPPEPGQPPGQPPPFTPLPEEPPAAPGPPKPLFQPRPESAPLIVAAPPLPQQYVQLGGAIGGNGSTAYGGVFAAIAVEVGYRIYKPFWLHAQVIIGESANQKSPTGFDGTLLHIRAGADWRRGIFFTGADVGYARERVGSTLAYSSFAAALRVGLDLSLGGGVRVRPCFELWGGDKLHGEPAINGKDYQGGDLSLALAYEWR